MGDKDNSAGTSRHTAETDATRGWRNQHFREGARDMARVAPGLAAWGLVTGVAMVKGGLAWPLAVAMSLAVFAGGAQLATVPLMHANAPVWLVLATAFCINLRFIIFSASWRPYLNPLPFGQRLRMAYFTADLNYVIFMHRFAHAPAQPEQVPYFWGGVTVNWLSWQLPSLLGIALAEHIAPQWGLEFAGTVALLALSCSLLNDRSTWAAAAAGGAAAVAALALPLKLNIVVAIAVAVAVGLLVERAAPRATPRAPTP